MNNREKAISTYSTGIRDYLNEYRWNKVIAKWEMTSDSYSGYFKIYDMTGEEIRPQYYRDANNLEQLKKVVPNTIKVGDKLIRELYLEESSSSNKKWNVLVLTIFNYENENSEFLWDEDLYYSILLTGNKYTSYYIWERLCEILWSSNIDLAETNWVYFSAVFEVKNNRLLFEPITLFYDDDKSIILELYIDPTLTDILLKHHQETNEMAQKGKWKEWNEMILYCPKEREFDPQTDVQYVIN